MKSPNFAIYWHSFVCNTVFCLDTKDRTLQASKSSIIQDGGTVYSLYSQQCATDYCTDGNNVFKLHGQQTLQSLKWGLFQAIPLATKPATLCVTLLVSFLCLATLFSVEGTISIPATSATCVSLLASTLENVHLFLNKQKFLFFGLLSVLKNES